ncbi:efflux RND transporter permease subunit [Thiohalorhabdus sp. Cl-TMA]|uniref:Efflux RND transporter permease subunit n=1 Tax=Thiohalorhabdus methylotrophus TaxID=3242694 RepID=A0ABV4TYX0_9GAMM
MNALIAAVFQRSRTVLLGFLLLLGFGVVAYQSIPKEAEPDVAIPVVFVSLLHEGISPEDAERLLLKPMEKELQSVEGLDEMRAVAMEGYAYLRLDFEAGLDPDAAVREVREQVDQARPELPPETEEPVVQEVDTSLFPVLTVGLSGPVAERTLVSLARTLRDELESLGGVLEVNIAGMREDVLEVLVDPLVMETYNLSYEQLYQLIQRNNQLVAAGAMDTGAGRLVVKVPGVLETFEDVMRLPVKSLGGTTVAFEDVATVRRTFKDPDSYARLGGQPALALEIRKRSDANIIETVAAARSVIARQSAGWPGTVQVDYLQDKAEDVRGLLGDLQNNVLSAVVLVMIVVIGVLGVRSGILTGLAIPGAFLTGVLGLWLLGSDMNIVVLFTLIMVVGMLVDGAIVVTELADRNLGAGMAPPVAYRAAAQRMAWPVTSSVATTMAVFVPLLFWPGVVGEFMRYLPITVLLTLAASWLMALVVLPVLGGVLGRGGGGSGAGLGPAGEGAVGRSYRRLLAHAVVRPGLALAASLAVLAAAFAGYAFLGKGVTFFADVEPDMVQVQVRARGDRSLEEKDVLVRQVEERVRQAAGIDSVYTRTLNASEARQDPNLTEDVIGVLSVELAEWSARPPAAAIIGELRGRTRDLPGLRIEVRKEEQGPSQGKPVQLELRAEEPEYLEPAVERVRVAMAETGGFADVEDSRPVPGVEWRLEVDRQKAVLYGADVALLGAAVQMVTNGYRVGAYRPEDTDEEVDIRVRFPFGERNLERLQQLRVPTERGMVPIGNFVDLHPGPKVGTIERKDGQRMRTVSADLEPGRLVAERVAALQRTLGEDGLPGPVKMRVAGEDEDRREAAGFLSTAFVTAVFLMTLILVTQFNSLYQAALVLSAIVLSSAGVLLGLLIRGEPFSVVMSGVGMIALAGVVVNDNIVLIDTYNALRAEGQPPVEAALGAGTLRFRPVVLTSVTTVLGLLPMVFEVNLDILHRNLEIGSPSTQWWVQLATSIAGGLTFATLLTLVVTPALLVLGARLGARFGRAGD